MKKFKIGFLGVGKMGGSILNGIVSSKLYSVRDVMLFDPSENVKNEYSLLGYCFSKDEIELFENCEIVVLNLFLKISFSPITYNL